MRLHATTNEQGRVVEVETDQVWDRDTYYRRLGRKGRPHEVENSGAQTRTDRRVFADWNLKGVVKVGGN